MASVDEGSSYSLAEGHEGYGLGASVIRDAIGCISRAGVRYPDVAPRPVMLEQSYTLSREAFLALTYINEVFSHTDTKASS